MEPYSEHAFMLGGVALVVGELLVLNYEGLQLVEAFESVGVGSLGPG